MNGCGELTGMAWVEESGIATGPYMLTGTGSVGLVHAALHAAGPQRLLGRVRAAAARASVRVEHVHAARSREQGGLLPDGEGGARSAAARAANVARSPLPSRSHPSHSSCPSACGVSAVAVVAGRARARRAQQRRAQRLAPRPLARQVAVRRRPRLQAARARVARGGARVRRAPPRAGPRRR